MASLREDGIDIGMPNEENNVGTAGRHDGTHFKSTQVAKALMGLFSKHGSEKQSPNLSSPRPDDATDEAFTESSTLEKGSEGDNHDTPVNAEAAQRQKNSSDSLRQRSTRPAQREGYELEPAPTSSRTRQELYLLKVGRGLMKYGAPTHRLEEYLNSTAQVLGLRIQSFYMPGIMIVSFNDENWRSTDVDIIRTTQELNLTKLYAVHGVYKEVIHEKTTLTDAIARLDEITNSKNQFSRWFRVLMYGVASACIGPVSYGARPIDLPIIFILGCLLGVMELILAYKSTLYAHVFEITAAIVTSFLARAFGSINLPGGHQFCFSALAQASLVLILPGFTVTNSALELQSKNIVSGAVRLVYGIIFVLFLAFGITIGTTIYGAIDSNASSATHCSNQWPFWWQIIFVPLFTLFYIIINQAPWRKMPAMILLTTAGWTVNHFSANFFKTNSQIANSLAALTAGIAANLYSRLGHGLAVALLNPAIFILVPGSLGAQGSLIAGVQSANEITRNNNTSVDPGTAATGTQVNTDVLRAGYAMVEIAIGITVGLSVSALVVYPMSWRKKGKGGLFSL